jgi:hypothetical protein
VHPFPTRLRRAPVSDIAFIDRFGVPMWPDRA